MPISIALASTERELLQRLAVSSKQPQAYSIFIMIFCQGRPSVLMSQGEPALPIMMAALILYQA